MYNILAQVAMVKANIQKILERIAATCARVNKDSGAITIVAVSKGRPPEEIREAVAAGITDIGENKVQEALLKYSVLTPNTQHPTPIKWHMVGHLQTNKVKEAIKVFDLIHSVDTLHLAKEIDRQAAKINKVQDILVEVKTSSEATKFGAKPEETLNLIKEIMQFKNVNLKGLMTIAPIVNKAEDARPYFRTLHQLFDKLNTLMTNDQRLMTLSMGMTDDFEIAIEEGSNMVRLGRAIFG